MANQQEIDYLVIQTTESYFKENITQTLLERVYT